MSKNPTASLRYQLSCSGICFCVDTDPFLYRSFRYRSGHFFQNFRSFPGTDQCRSGIGLVFTVPVLVHSGPISVFLNKTGIVPVFYKRTGIMHRYWTGKRPVLHRYFVPVKYRSNTGPFHRYWNGNFQGSSVPFRFRSLPFRSVPIPLHCTVEKKPPQLTKTIV